MQADRRALNITLNSIGTELTRDDRRKLYSNFGLLYPHGHHELASAEDFDQIRNAMEKCPPYQALFNKLGYGESQMLDKVCIIRHGFSQSVISYVKFRWRLCRAAARRFRILSACTFCGDEHPTSGNASEHTVTLLSGKTYETATAPVWFAPAAPVMHP